MSEAEERVFVDFVEDEHDGRLVCRRCGWVPDPRRPAARQIRQHVLDELLGDVL